MISLTNRLLGSGLVLTGIVAPVATSIVAPVAQAATTSTMVTYYSSTNVRSAASLSSKVVSSLPANRTVTGTVTGTWMKISSPSNLAGRYISTTVLKAKSTTTTPTSSTTATRYTYYSSTNIRSGPSTSTSITGRVGAGTKFTGVISGSWMKISTPSNHAGRYISTTVLTSTAPSGSTTTPTPPKTLPTSGTYAGGTLGPSYTMYSGYNGIKVYLAQKKLGMNPGPMSSTMNSATTSKIMSFQRNNGIPATGALDQKTWDALNTGYPFTIDTWRKNSDVASNASRDQKVAAMVNYARAQLNKPYIWGGTGPMGFDCSGLMLQAVRAGGMKPKTVDNFTNIRPSSDLANSMWKSSEFQRGSLSNLRYGDLIYYGGSDGVAHHVTMYVGNNTVINSINLNNAKVSYLSLSSNAGWSRKLGVNRAFAL